jgi:serine protease Do
MSLRFTRARYGAAIAVAFLCGLIFASGFDLTPFGWAQNKSAAKPTAQQVQPLVESQNAFEAIADHATPAVVSIQTERFARQRPSARGQSPRGQQLPPGFDQFFRQFDNGSPSDQPQEASGSGFIVSKDGYILTNNHVVADADKVTVGLLDRRVFEAKVIGRDPTTDVAVIKIDANNLPTVQLGDDSQMRVGQWVLAIGNPLALNFTVTAGIVSAKGRNQSGLLGSSYAITDYIQTDAAINPGNSGGPLLNIKGDVIGINSAIASGTGYYAGYGFAIPISLAKQVMDDIIEFGKVRRAIMGVGLNEVSPTDAKAAGLTEIRGAKVSSFVPEDNSPAVKAGMEIGDVIITAGGRQVDGVNQLQRIVRGYKPGQTIEIDAMRFGQKKSFKVRLAEPPNEEQTTASNDRGSRAPVSNEAGRSYDKLGITVETITSQKANELQLSDATRRGLLVTQVSGRGPAYRNLVEGQIILQVLYPTKQDIHSPADLEQAISSLKSGDVIELKIWTPGPSGTGATSAVSMAVAK